MVAVCSMASVGGTSGEISWVSGALAFGKDHCRQAVQFDLRKLVFADLQIVEFRTSIITSVDGGPNACMINCHTDGGELQPRHGTSPAQRRQKLLRAPHI